MRRISVRGTSTFSAATLGVVVLTLSTAAVGAPDTATTVGEPVSVATQDAISVSAHHRLSLHRAERIKHREAKAKRHARERAAKHRAAKHREARHRAAQRRAEAVRASRSAARPGSNRALGRSMAAAKGWGDVQFSCLDRLWTAESGWSTSAHNPSGAYGIPQAKPGSKMAAAGSDWATNARTQIAWGLSYIQARYGTPCSAYGSFQSRGWY